MGAVSAGPADEGVAGGSNDPSATTGRDGSPGRRGGPVLLVGSNGGHLAQLVPLRSWLSGRDRAWVTFRKADAVSQLAGERVHWAYFPTTRNVPNLVRNFFLAIRVLRAERPRAIISTGAAVAFPFFVVGRLMRIPTVYVEVFDRMDSPTLTGRLCRPFSSMMCVQWPEQARFYPSARVVGPLL
jgi:UDP-N-acetylglucosamine:LPS N-acetylglucosamine transferase